jgi:hypothetical protein
MPLERACRAHAVRGEALVEPASRSESPEALAAREQTPDARVDPGPKLENEPLRSWGGRRHRRPGPTLCVDRHRSRGVRALDHGRQRAFESEEEKEEDEGGNSSRRGMHGERVTLSRSGGQRISTGGSPARARASAFPAGPSCAWRHAQTSTLV